VNVLHVHSGNMFGGVERMLHTLAPATSGVSPVSSSFALCFKGAVSESLQSAGAAVHDLGPVKVRRPDEIVRARRALRDVLNSDRWSAAIVHSAWGQGIFGSTILKSGVPMVRWLHAPQPGPRWLEYWSARSRPALVICNSNYTRNAVRWPLAGARLSVLYPPSVPPPSQLGARESMRASLGTPAGTVVVALAARLEAGKGHRLFVEALATIPAVRWEAWIIGGVQQQHEREYLAGLQRQIAAADLSGRVRLLGQRENVPALLEAADVYCQPNQAPDSFGLSFVEALSAGLPVITTAMGAAAEIVDPSCGLLVEPASAVALSNALRTLIEGDGVRQTLSAGAAARARQFCNLPASLRQFAEQIATVSNASVAST